MGKKIKLIRKKPAIKYAGSLVQNNFGESLEKGYLIWDLNSKESEFVKINNVYGYYTIDIFDENIPEIDDIPEKCRLRIKVHNLNNSQLNNVIIKLRKKYKPYEITINRVNVINDTENNKNSLDILNIKDVNYQNELLRTYLGVNYNVSDDIINEILEINKSLNLSIEIEEFIRNVRWKPIKFKWSNMFSYGEENIIDFENFTGTYGVFAPNASGKSALMDSLTFCLFDKTTREFKPLNIMNNKSNWFECEISFMLDLRKYVIKKHAKRDKNDKLTYKVDFYSIDEFGKKTSLNGENRWETNKNIRNKIGTFEDFILSTYSVQDNSTGFIDSGHTERKDLIIEFIGLGLFDSLYELASVTLKDIQNKVKFLQNKNLTNELNILSKENLTLLQEYDDLINEKDVHSIQLKENEIEIKKLNSNLINVGIEYDIDKLEKEKDNLILDHNNCISKINEIESKIINKQNYINKTASDINLYNSLNIKKMYDEYNLLQIDKINLDNELKTLKIDIENKLEKMKKLGDLKYDPNCTYCMNNIFVKDAINTKKELETDKNIYISTKDKLNSVTSIINSKKDIEDEYNKYLKLLEQLKTVKNELNLVKGNLNTQNTILDGIKLKLEINEKSISEYKKNENNIKNNNFIKSKINTIEKENLKISKIIEDLDENILSKFADLRVNESKIENTKNEIKELSDASIEYDIYKYYVEAIRRDGIPYDIISKVVPIIEHEVNNILGQIVDFTIVIELDESKNINTFISYGDSKKWALELSSGMEKFISSIALRVALTNISNLPRPNFLIVDEGWGKLDSENLNSVHLLLEYLKTQFDFIMIISHIDEMKDMVDHSIEIKKDKLNKSKILHFI